MCFGRVDDQQWENEIMLLLGGITMGGAVRVKTTDAIEMRGKRSKDGMISWKFEADEKI